MSAGTAEGDDPADAVRERLLSEHGALFDAVDAVADAVAARWENPGSDDDGTADGPPVTADRDAVVPAMRDALAAADLLDRLPATLATGANALGVDLPASPVPTPPYLVVTATGPVVRATFPDRGRLVISVRVFDVDRDGDAPAYRRVDADAREALTVELR
ncbi:hypothetical protein Hbl1158_09620 [Halobaculum sp. CBA1158]|uniref:hypothetical protein n=1 Tax=Halobaculum sp. CBA1158 TaxID=2904243 RepID=UPI001F47173F|nr:hypothetical protein [Halobaculum sp. CBA1158]UIO98798.1 hypothetical protein Hbl1158_09620 [Halobaculum sp. CBA1158]